MRITNIFLIVLASLSLIACGGDDDKTGFGEGGVDEKVQDLTDYSNCDGGTPSGTHLRSNAWGISMLQEGQKMTQAFEIMANNTIKMKVTCHFGDQKVASEIIFPVEITTTQIKVLGERTDETRFETAEGVFICQVSMPKVNLNYSFKGKCLALSVGNEKAEVFPPAVY